jgi:hypothetical protein
VERELAMGAAVVHGENFAAFAAGQDDRLAAEHG